MDIEPQSIVHQVIRLERTVARMVKRTISSGSMSRRRRKQRNSSVANKDSGHSIMASTFCSSSRDASGKVSKYASDDEPSFHESGDGPSFNESSHEELAVFDKEIKDLTSISVPETHYRDYRTINQNEFFIECMINGEGTSTVIHFFDKNNNLCREVDELLEKTAKKFTTCKFLRIDSAWTQFVSAKLGIEKFPTVLAIRDKVVLDRLSDFEGMDLFFSEDFLHEWLVQTIPLINGHHP
jgi:hypothetical protein